jgi:hypothetical protein
MDRTEGGHKIMNAVHRVKLKGFGGEESVNSEYANNSGHHESYRGQGYSQSSSLTPNCRDVHRLSPYGISVSLIATADSSAQSYPHPGCFAKEAAIVDFAGDNFFGSAKEAANYSKQIV